MPKAAKAHKPMPRMAKAHVPAPVQTDSWRSQKGKTAERGYGGRWQRARLTFLSRPENVLCRMCAEDGHTTLATVVDHVIPHRGDQVRFWDTSNWQPLCASCHSSRKQAEEKGGKAAVRVGMDGLPVARPGGGSNVQDRSDA